MYYAIINSASKIILAYGRKENIEHSNVLNNFEEMLVMFLMCIRKGLLAFFIILNHFPLNLCTLHSV